MLGQAERRVNVRNQQEGISVDTQGPAAHADDEIEEGARVLTGEQDDKPGDDHHEDGCGCQ